MYQVTKDQFYKYVNPRDICVKCVKSAWDNGDGELKAITHFRTRSDILVGISEHNYDTQESRYLLTTEAMKELEKQGDL